MINTVEFYSKHYDAIKEVSPFSSVRIEQASGAVAHLADLGQLYDWLDERETVITSQKIGRGPGRSWSARYRLTITEKEAACEPRTA